MIIDLYGGCGGWAEGLRLLGRDEIGIELDPSACATRHAAEHRVIRADVATYPLGPLAGRVEGLIASPPCQAFSAAGNGKGRDLLHELRADIDRGDVGCRYPEGVGHVLQVGRWAETLRPRWIAAEQVPPVLPLWRAYARRLAALGYSTWAGVLNAANYGVPQTRKRAILIASLDHPAGPPSQTHARRPEPQLFGELAPWVSMAEALGWGLPDEPSPVVMTARNRQTGHDALNGSSWRRDWFRRQQEDGNWILRPGAQAHRDRPTLPRPVSSPAPTLNFGHDSARWVWERPATTIAGDPRITARCHHDEGTHGANAKTTDEVRAGDYEGTEPIRLTITEALILQSFRPDYPVQGTKTKRFEQVGNAVPPLLAAHIVAALTGRPAPTR